MIELVTTEKQGAVDTLNRGFSDISKAFQDAGKAVSDAANTVDVLGLTHSGARKNADEGEASSWDTEEEEVWDEEELTRSNKNVLDKIQKEKRAQDAIIEKMIEKLHLVDTYSKKIGEQLQVEQSALEKIKAENEVNTAELKVTIERVNTSMGKGGGDSGDSDGEGGGGGGGGDVGDDLIPKPTLATKAKVGMALAKGVSTVSGLLS